MRVDSFTKFLLVVIAFCLSLIALRPYLAPAGVKAQSGEPSRFYVEPGTVMLRAPDGSRQVLGKVVIDLRNGNAWGFPTLTQDPYPASTPSGAPPVSHPFLLGKFALAEMEK